MVRALGYFFAHGYFHTACVFHLLRMFLHFMRSCMVLIGLFFLVIRCGGLYILGINLKSAVELLNFSLLWAVFSLEYFFGHAKPF